MNPVVAFLSAYNHKTIPEHLKSVIYALWYVHSTPDIGMNFYYTRVTETHAQIHNPLTHYKEAYTNTSDPMPSSQHELTVYYDSCWGSKVESATKKGT